MATPPPLRNRLLNALSTADFNLLKPHLEPIRLDLRFVLEKPNQPIGHVYFPESGLVSVVAHTKGDRSIEVGLIGWEGMSGLSIVMGDDRSPNECYIQGAGWGSRISVEKFVPLLEGSASMRKCLLHYLQAFLCQTSQTALCNGRAKLEERLARWLLMGHDRFDGDELKLTHAFLSLMLGVRRPGVTEALHFLEGKGLIRSNRGVVKVIDREGLEHTAAGSYGVPEAVYARLFGDQTSGAVSVNRAP